MKGNQNMEVGIGVSQALLLLLTSVLVNGILIFGSKENGPIRKLVFPIWLMLLLVLASSLTVSTVEPSKMIVHRIACTVNK